MLPHIRIEGRGHDLADWTGLRAWFSDVDGRPSEDDDPHPTGAGIDVTTYATISPDAVAHGEFIVRRPGTVAGL